MAKDVQAALEAEKVVDQDGDGEAAELEHSPRFKKTFTREEQTEISMKRREMRDRLFADD